MKRLFLTGASSGIGLASAKLLVAQGQQVWGTPRNLERFPKLPRLHGVVLDLSDPTRRKCLHRRKNIYGPVFCGPGR